MDFEEINPQTWKPEQDGDSVTGELVKKEHDVGVNHSNLYHLKTVDGKQISVWGSTVLDNRLEFVEEGAVIRITYKETKENKRGQPVKIFKVEKEKIGSDAKASDSYPFIELGRMH